MRLYLQNAKSELPIYHYNVPIVKKKGKKKKNENNSSSKPNRRKMMVCGMSTR